MTVMSEFLCLEQVEGFDLNLLFYAGKMSLFDFPHTLIE